MVNIQDGLAEALDVETEVSENIQNALTLNEDVADINQILKLYQWIKANSLKLIIGIVGLIIGLSSYFFYSQNIKKTTSHHLQRIDRKLEYISQKIETIQKEISLVKVNQANINNIEYRIESLKKINSLELQIKSSKHKQHK